MKKLIDYDVADLSLAEKGKKKIEWAGQQMPVVKLVGKRFSKDKILKGVTVGACLHVTSETANLMLALKVGGAKLALCASNPLSTQDEVAASLVKDFGISVYAIHGENNKNYYEHIDKVIEQKPEITMDDGADLVNTLHTKRTKQIADVIGSSEETTTGVIRLRAMEKDGALRIPVIAVNDSDTKHLFDNRYGTGQSTIDGILRATNILLAGKKFVVCGYGWCSRGIAMRARGMGANVIITEVDPVKALEAVMDGYRVMKISEACKTGDIFVTATGDKSVISVNEMQKMKNGAILANSGHFNVEIEVEKLGKVCLKKRNLRDNLMEYEMESGKKIFILGEGRLVNLVAAEGHPAEVMDLSFANQALAAEYFVKNRGKLQNKVYRLPSEIDIRVAKLKLKALGVGIDKLTSEQKRYLQSWREGT